MSLKNLLRPFVPPIVWAGFGRAVTSFRKPRAETKAAKDIMAMTSTQDFSIDLRRVTLHSDTYFVPEYAAHRPAAKCILTGTLYEPATHALISELLRNRPGNLVHAGTFFGDMLPSFSRACSSKVYAFEPVLENYILAKLCVQENGLENVILCNAGLGSTVTVARIDTGDEDGVHRGGASHIGERGQFATLLTIDCFRIPNLSIIQLDVEGHELDALRGAIESIERDSPIVMIEDNNENCASFLSSVSYSLSGKIPGLSIWKSSKDETEVQNIIQRL